MNRKRIRAAATAVAVVSVSVVCPAGGKHAAEGLFTQKLTNDQQVLHALNRLTFGATPADAESVRRLGVRKWVERQLHPESIPENPKLQELLKPLNSLAMAAAEMTKRYPPPQYVMAVAMGKAPMPRDPEERVILERLAARYKARLEKKHAGDELLKPSEKTPVEELLSPSEIRTLRRGTEEERAALLKTMPQERLDQLAFNLPEQARGRLLAVAPVEIRRKMLLYSAPQQVVAQDLAEAKLYRAVYGNRQLQEVLADFWFNHFNVYLDKGADRYLVTAYERDVIREHVLGKFRDLLQATAEDPAMLFYLDNWQSVAANTDRQGAMRKKGTRGLNENYARELLELHTMGVDGGYTQKDIIEVARCFTGWTIKAPFQGAGFQFNERVHDKGEKVVLGVTVPAGGGREDGLKVLDILAHQPATARFISKKLAIRFVADNPPKALVDAMAVTFQKTDGDIRAVMETMLRSKEFWSQGAYRAKMKSPLEMVASALRATGANMDSAILVAQKIGELGEPLYRKQEPTGYSNSGEEWVNSASLLGRMNFALALTSNQLRGVKVDAGKFEGDPTHVAQALLLTPPTAQTKEAIDRGLAEKKEPSVLAGLVLGSPEFQRR